MIFCFPFSSVFLNSINQPKETIMHNLKVYIAGPMTGLPGHNYDAFHKAADQLLKQGFTVFNPANNKGSDWQQFMRRSLEQIAQVDMLFMLRGWEKSRGARLEQHLATEMGILVKYQRPEGWGEGILARTAEPKDPTISDQKEEAAKKDVVPRNYLLYYRSHNQQPWKTNGVGMTFDEASASMRMLAHMDPAMLSRVLHRQCLPVN